MEEVEKYLKDHVFGNPQLKPDEKNKFLGNFQERVAIALTISQAKAPENLKIVKKVMTDNPKSHMYINGNMDQVTVGKYIALAAGENYKFTIISQEKVRVSNEKTDNEMGVVIANEKDPVTKPVII